MLGHQRWVAPLAFLDWDCHVIGRQNDAERVSIAKAAEDCHPCRGFLRIKKELIKQKISDLFSFCVVLFAHCSAFSSWFELLPGNEINQAIGQQPLQLGEGTNEPEASLWTPLRNLLVRAA